ncbi:MAG TPA: FAD-dependent monooxygenase [Pseudolabrys sp.]|nr:FAD-dependent monooxygenase [Pseudolabrys sp.]
MAGPEKRRAVVIGGSMSGLLSGLLLRRAGWSVDIYERVDSKLSGRGAGIVAQAELIERLRGLGLPTEDLGVQITTRKILDAQGRFTQEYECPQVLTAWERVYRLLRDAFPPQHYHRGRGLARFTQDADKVTAHFSDGETVDADLLVGADGLRSTVRQQAAPAVLPLYAGYSAWRALIAESAFPPDVHRDLFAFMTFALPPGEQFLGYPVAGPDNDLRPGHRRYNVVWYRPADENTKLKWLLTDDRGVTHAISIPPPLIRREVIAEMRADAERLLGPQLRQVARLMEEPILQPIYDLESPQMAFGRVAIVGDAAFVARPHVAAGVSKAADDAAALAEALAAEGDVAQALKRFEAARLSENFRIIERARHLGAFLQATRTQEEQARAGRHSTDEAVIVETAVLDFLYA